jgi:serine/threonine-protein kinase
MGLSSGTRLGHYEILSSAGSGAMGEVYRARDAKLGRTVAVKFLLPSVAADPARLARFAREAQVLASLNHPNIAQIYGLEETDAGPALVMELVEGPTLEERIARGALPLDEALAIAKQIAEALEAAHEQGIVHRDLKPANVKLGRDDAVKVLDFGLAKTMERAAAGVDPEARTAVTHDGVIVGTAAYMSPEQAEGRPVDRRTDLWAFGVILLEMLTGRRVFPGETLTQVLAAVLRADPDWSSLPAGTPRSIRTLLRRCLEKDRRRRLSSAADARLEIEDALAAPAIESAGPDIRVPPQPRRHRALIVVALLGLALAVAGPIAVWTALRQRGAAEIGFEIIPPAPATLNVGGSWPEIAIAADGSSVVYTVGPRRQLVVRAIGSIDAVALSGATGARSPFLSPDGRWVGYFTGVSGELKKVPIGGGPPISICRFVGSARGASWGEDDEIVFATNEPSTGLLRVPASGGEPEVLTPATHEGDHLFPSVVRGGRAVVFTIGPGAGTGGTTFLAVFDLRNRRQKVLLRGGSGAAYVETGHLLYGAEGELRAVGFDPKALQVLGDPSTVVKGVSMSPANSVNFAIARDGTLAYVPASGVGEPASATQLAWVDRAGKETIIASPPRRYGNARVSPSGTHLAFSIADGENDVWTWDFARQTLARLTFDPRRDWYPSWSPDGRRIAFISTRTGVGHLYVKAADGTGTDEQLTAGENVQFGAPSFSPDGMRVVFTEVRPGSGEDVMMLALDRGRLVTPLLQSKFAERNPEISPDGRWMAYESNESGLEEIYVRPFPNVGGGRWQVSSGGGTTPVWSRAGRELFYRDLSSVLAVDIRTEPAFAAGTPRRLFDGPYLSALSASFDVSPDGQRFLMIKDPPPAGDTPLPRIVVMVDWGERLKREP